ncbi:hypothetical protein J6590_010542 [Homalodisca vitripennis]|nr:hypothetical protein J6590_010542 [Homalodisca vitripennis]
MVTRTTCEAISDTSYQPVYNYKCRLRLLLDLTYGLVGTQHFFLRARENKATVRLSCLSVAARAKSEELVLRMTRES